MRKPNGVFWASLIVFFIPVVLSALVAPRFFESEGVFGRGLFFSSNPSLDISEQGAARARFSESQEESLIGDEKAAPSFTKVASDEFLDPAKKGTFIVSFFARLPNVPPESYRLKLITKYESKASPYQGWAIALKQQSGSLRPEVYWRGENSKGGWYSFGALDLSPDEWHQFTLVVEGGKVLSLFLNSDVKLSEAGVLDEKNKENDSVFLGGFDVEEVELPSSGGSLELRAPLPRPNSDSVELTDVVVASYSKSKTPIDHLIGLKADQLMKKLGNDSIHLWIDSQGRDRSRLGRNLSFS